MCQAQGDDFCGILGSEAHAETLLAPAVQIASLFIEPGIRMETA